MRPTFHLGAHHAAWLGRAGVSLFVSRRTLAPRKTLPRAMAPWVLDSGGFTELSMHGAWTLDARSYANEARRFRDEIGLLAWCAPQDWMCEPAMLARTGLTVAEHQRRTVANFLELLATAPDVPWIPVLQGWTLGDYLDCVDLYSAAGVDLPALPLVGIGTVCRRQGTGAAERIIRWLASDGIRLHGYPIKETGLLRCADALVSADSMAWSFHARKRPPLDGCVGHKNCANCLRYALAWRDDVLSAIDKRVS